MFDPDLIGTIAQTVKVALVTHYATVGFDLPAFQQIVPGLPAYDCEMVAIQAEAILPHGGSASLDVTAQAHKYEPAHSMRYVRLAIVILRCVPGPHDDGKPPTVAETEAAAAVILRDAILVGNALLTAELAGEFTGCSGMAVESWEGVEPSGGLGGGILRVRFDLTGW
jgi:hypothetical protein